MLYLLYRVWRGASGVHLLDTVGAGVESLEWRPSQELDKEQEGGIKLNVGQ